MWKLLNRCHRYNPVTLLVSGGAIGADSLGQRWANENGIAVRIYPPDWKLGRAAGMIRNRTIVDNSDRVIAFWSGASPGTLGAMNIALTLGKPIRYVLPDGTIHTWKGGRK